MLDRSQVFTNLGYSGAPTAPVVNWNSPGLMAMLSAGGNQGIALSGSAALDPILAQGQFSGAFKDNPELRATALKNLARNVGIDSGEYDLTSQFDLARKRIQGLSQDQQPTAYNSSGIKPGADQLQDRIDKEFGDVWNIGGMTGLNPKDPRQYGNTLYQLSNGTFTPLTSTKLTHQSDQADQTHASVGELISALSVALPMFGGWAGILGGGTAGTLTAGGGLGLTTGLTSAVGSTAANAAIGGLTGYATGGTGGLLSGIAGSLGGAGGSSLASAAGISPAIGAQLGSTIGNYLATGRTPGTQSLLGLFGPDNLGRIINLIS